MKRRNVGILILLTCCFLGAATKGLPANWSSSDEFNDLSKFLDLRDKLSRNIKDSERLKIEFSLAEYYFMLNAFRDAKEAFQDIVEKNKGGIPTLLANVYLYRLEEIKGKDPQVLLELRKKIFQGQFILLFNKYKTLSFQSSWGRSYEIHYFVDKIAVYRDGEMFEEMTP